MQQERVLKLYGLIINEDSADIDFKMESNGNANALQMNGGTGHFGMGNASSANYQLLMTHDGYSYAAQKIICTTDGAAYGLFIDFTNTAQNGTSQYFMKFEDSSAARLYVYANGDVYTATGTDIQTISDGRLKENIVDYTSGLECINALSPRTFTWKDGTDKPSGTQFGFIAQEIEEAVNNADNDLDNQMALFSTVPLDDNDEEVEENQVIRDLIPDGTKYATQMGKKDALYVSAIKELLARVTVLEAQIN